MLKPSGWKQDVGMRSSEAMQGPEWGALKVLPCGSWSGCDAAEEVLGLVVVTRGLRLVGLPVTMTQGKL